MARYLVTGGAGFIGSNIVEELVNRGEEVRILDDLSTGREENLSGFEERVEVVRGDIRDRKVVRNAMAGVDYVLHQAAIPSVQRSVDNPLDSSSVNVEGTLLLLTEARDARVERFVYASSSSVYGDSPTLPKVETMAPDPKSPYAVSKLAAEFYAIQFYTLYGLKTVCLRYFNVFGPRQDPSSEYSAVIPKFAKALLEGKRPVIYGDGKQTRDFTFVKNVINANLLACVAPEEAWGNVFNVGTGGRISLLEVLAIIAREGSGEMLEPHLEPARKGDVKDSLAGIEKARKLLGYDIEIDLSEGLKRTLEFYEGMF